MTDFGPAGYPGEFDPSSPRGGEFSTRQLGPLRQEMHTKPEQLSQEMVVGLAEGNAAQVHKIWVAQAEAMLQFSGGENARSILENAPNARSLLMGKDGGGQRYFHDVVLPRLTSPSSGDEYDLRLAVSMFPTSTDSTGRFLSQGKILSRTSMQSFFSFSRFRRNQPTQQPVGSVTERLAESIPRMGTVSAVTRALRSRYGDHSGDMLALMGEAELISVLGMLNAGDQMTAWHHRRFAEFLNLAHRVGIKRETIPPEVSDTIAQVRNRELEYMRASAGGGRRPEGGQPNVPPFVGPLGAAAMSGESEPRTEPGKPVVTLPRANLNRTSASGKGRAPMYDRKAIGEHLQGMRRLLSMPDSLEPQLRTLLNDPEASFEDRAAVWAAMALRSRGPTPLPEERTQLAIYLESMSNPRMLEELRSRLPAVAEGTAPPELYQLAVDIVSRRPDSLTERLRARGVDKETRRHADLVFEEAWVALTRDVRRAYKHEHIARANYQDPRLPFLAACRARDQFGTGAETPIPVQVALEQQVVANAARVGRKEREFMPPQVKTTLKNVESDLRTLPRNRTKLSEYVARKEALRLQALEIERRRQQAGQGGSGGPAGRSGPGRRPDGTLPGGFRPDGSGRRGSPPSGQGPSGGGRW